MTLLDEGALSSTKGDFFMTLLNERSQLMTLLIGVKPTTKHVGVKSTTFLNCNEMVEWDLQTNAGRASNNEMAQLQRREALKI